MIRTENGRTALGAVWFKRVNGYVYAYLRYTSGGKARARYIGPATADGRKEALQAAWAQAQQQSLAS